MSTRLPLFKIEAILHDHLQPYRCECHPQADRSLTVRLYGEQAERDELTVLGIRYDQCRDAANLVRLAQELRIELYATRSELAGDRATAK
ncbi:DUF1652 domain-containing protein [Pseudomonas oligotrophica]|uniref:DUF1652 domain-containing protein n=1 Tax=Pseudomonas oligotrophica TaxID=2912055 RepID=UPI001F44C79C|nr:DUF1652 domain-containing protein [Pseudomonas oligotrophica]MCF7202499.1 DUF1652 domain-containing protein [Pseudomonas oligotrophica]